MSRAHEARIMQAAGYRCGASAALFAAMAVEAFPNDLAHLLSAFVTKSDSSEIQELRDVLPDFERDKLQIKLKYALLYFILTKQPAPRGGVIFQNFELLIGVRNEIAHRKPAFVEMNKNGIPYTAGQRISKLVTRLESVGAIDRKISTDPKQMPAQWLILIDQSKAFSSWAVKSAQEIILEIYRVFPESAFKEKFLSSLLGPTSTFMGAHIYGQK